MTDLDLLRAGTKKMIADGYTRPLIDNEAVLALLDRLETAEAAIQRVRDLHKRSHAVFSWQSGIRYESPCPTCDGKAGVHECGCWADQQIEYVCAECHRLGATSYGIYDYTWPCPTIQALGDQK